MNTKLFVGSVVFDQLGYAWDTLVEKSMTNTPFQRLAYQESWWKNLGPGNLYSVVVYDNNAELAGIGCFYLVGNSLFFNGCVEESDYLDIIAPPDKTESVWNEILDSLTNPEFPNWDCIDLCNVPLESPTRLILPRLAQQRGFTFSTEIHEVCPIIPLPESFEDYLASLDKKQRHEVRRKMRRADEAGLEIRSIGPDDNLDKAVDDFLKLLQKSTPDKAEWLNDARTALFHELSAALMADGTLQLLFAVIEDELAAALYNLDYNGRIWVYNSGFDPEAFSHLSAGVVLTARAIEIAIENGRKTFDFLRGNETYKYRFGAVDSTVHRLVIERG